MKILRILGIAMLACIVTVALGIGVLFALFDGEKVKQQLAHMVQQHTQRSLQIPGEVGLSVWPNLAITVGQASLSEPHSTQPFASIDSARISVAVRALFSGTVAINALKLEGFKVTVIKHKDGRFNFSDLLAQQSSLTEKDKANSIKPDAAARPVRVDIDAIELNNAQLVWLDEKTLARTSLSDLDVSTGRIQIDTGAGTYKIKKLDIDARGKAGADVFTLHVDAPQLNLVGQNANSDMLTALATLRGARRALQAKFTLQGIQASAQSVQVKKLQAEVDAQANNAGVQAQITSPLLVRVFEQTLDLARLDGKLDLTHPAMPMKRLSLPLSGRARVDVAKSTAAVEFDTQVDDSTVHLSLDVLKFAPLALGFDLKVGKINLDKYLASSASSNVAAKSEASSAASQVDTVKVDLSALQKLNVHGNIQINALQVSNIKMDQVQAKLSVRDGQLSLAPFSADLYQGRAQGRLLAQAPSNTIALRQTLSDINIGPLLKDVANKDFLEGRGNLSLDVNSRGTTVGALKKALQGSAGLRLRDGAVKGINLAKSFRELKAKWSMGAASSTQQANSADQTDFSELTANFRIAGGVARNDDLAMKSPFLRLGGFGDVDIGNSQLDYLAKVSVVNTDAGQGGKELDQLKGLTIPVRLSGPFSAPNYRIEFGNMFSDVAKAKVQAQVEEQKAKVQAQVEEKKQELGKKAEDALKEKLQDLFKR